MIPTDNHSKSECAAKDSGRAYLNRNGGLRADMPLSAWAPHFPGQQIGTDGLPNRRRLEMHLARGLVRAAERGDFAIAAVYHDRLYRIPRMSRDELRREVIAEAQTRRFLSCEGSAE